MKWVHTSVTTDGETTLSWVAETPAGRAQVIQYPDGAVLMKSCGSPTIAVEDDGDRVEVAKRRCCRMAVPAVITKRDECNAWLEEHGDPLPW